MSKSGKTLASILLVLGVGALVVGGTSKWFTDFSAYTSAGDKVRDWANGSASSSNSSSGGSGSSSDESSKPAVQVKLLSTGTDADGHETRTFGYSVEPASATNQGITISLSWTDSSVTDTLSDYLSSSFDTSSKTITVTMKQRFSHQATLTVTSVENPSLFSKVTIDAMRNMTSLSLNSTYMENNVRFIKTLSDSSDYVHYANRIITQQGPDGNDFTTMMPSFDINGTFLPITSALSPVFDTAYTKVPTAPNPSYTVEYTSDSLFLSYVTDAGGENEYTYMFGTLQGVSPLENNDLSLGLGSTAPASTETFTAAQVVTRINEKLNALTDAKRSALNTFLSDSGKTSKRIAVVTTWQVTGKYGSNSITVPVTMGLEVPYDSVSFKVPVTGVTASETGIEF